MCTERKATGEYVLACFMFATMLTIADNAFNYSVELCIIFISSRVQWLTSLRDRVLDLRSSGLWFKLHVFQFLSYRSF